MGPAKFLFRMECFQNRFEVHKYLSLFRQISPRFGILHYTHYNCMKKGLVKKQLKSYLMVEIPMLSILHTYIIAEQAIFDQRAILDLVVIEEEAFSLMTRSRMTFWSKIACSEKDHIIIIKSYYTAHVR